MVDTEVFICGVHECTYDVACYYDMDTCVSMGIHCNI